MVTLNTERVLERAQSLPFAPPYWDLQRRHALARVLDKGLPSTKNELWKYTDIRKFTDETLPFHNDAPKGVQALVASNAIDSMETLVVVDGVIDFELSTVAAGVEVQRFSDALNNDDPRLQNIAESSALGKSSHLRDLNTVLSHDGVVLIAGEECQSTVHCLWINTGIEVHTRLIVLAHHDISLVETFAGASTGFSNHMSEVFVDEGKSVQHSVVQNLSEHERLVRRADVTCEKESRYESTLVDVGGKAVRHDINVRLRGEGAFASAIGAYVLGGEQHNDVHLRFDHVAPHCESIQKFYGVLDDKSRGVFDGLAFIHKDAQKTNAEQANHNLLLSEDAEIDTKPELEIFADDVTCAHGATVGQLDPMALFYLESRGIPTDESRAILTRAFVARGTDAFPEGVQERAAALVALKLDNALEESS